MTTIASQLQELKRLHCNPNAVIKEVPGGTDLYASADGHVFQAVKGKLTYRQPYVSESNTSRVCVKVNGKWVNVKVWEIIARTFIGRPPNPKAWIHYKDGNRQNLNVSNLCYQVARTRLSKPVEATTSSAEVVKQDQPQATTTAGNLSNEHLFDTSTYLQFTHNLYPRSAETITSSVDSVTGDVTMIHIIVFKKPVS